MNVLTVPKSFYKFFFEFKISRFQDSRNKTLIKPLQSSSFKTSGNRLTFWFRTGFWLLRDATNTDVATTLRDFRSFFTSIFLYIYYTDLFLSICFV